MKITKNQLRRIIREERSRLMAEQNSDPSSEGDSAKSSQDLVNWFVEKRTAIRDARIPANQIPALIDALEAVIEAAQSGRLKAKGDYLAGVMDKISGQ